MTEDERAITDLRRRLSTAARTRLTTLRPSLGVVMLLLASVGPASAECAWVLTPVFGTSDRGDCTQEQEAAMKKQRKATTGENEEVAGPNVVCKKSQRTPLMILRHVCRPDTDDPRGPKGGAR
jgi:hypothetical protein